METQSALSFFVFAHNSLEMTFVFLSMVEDLVLFELT